MRRPSVLRRLAAAATGLWLVASSSVSPLLACEAHGGMRGHAHGAPAAPVAEASEQGSCAPRAAAPGEHHASHDHHGATALAVVPTGHSGHGAAESVPVAQAHDEHGHGAHQAVPPVAADAPSPAHDQQGNEGAPCTCAGSCCPSALVAVPGLAVAVAHATLVEVAVAATVAPTPVVPETAPQRRQPPATPPPVRTLS